MSSPVERGVNEAESNPLEGPAAGTESSNYDSGNLPLMTAIRTYPKIVGYILSCCSAILFFGYDAVIVGSLTAMPVFQYAFNVELEKA